MLEGRWIWVETSDAFPQIPVYFGRKFEYISSLRCHCVQGLGAAHCARHGLVPDFFPPLTAFPYHMPLFSVGLDRHCYWAVFCQGHCPLVHVFMLLEATQKQRHRLNHRKPQVLHRTPQFHRLQHLSVFDHMPN